MPAPPRDQTRRGRRAWRTVGSDGAQRGSDATLAFDVRPALHGRLVGLGDLGIEVVDLRRGLLAAGRWAISTVERTGVTAIGSHVSPLGVVAGSGSSR